MLSLANQIPMTPPPADEISTRGLLDQIAAYGARRLVFSYDGREVLPGYHVTEVKDGRFEGLDCGANPEAWRETFIQLWDVPGDDDRASHMPAAKFSAIINTVQQTVPFDTDAKLTFEVSDGDGAIRLYRADRIEIEGERVLVSLGRRPASCKPRDRWLEQERASCGGGGKQPCCG